MKYFRVIVLAFFLSSISVFSQDNIIKHSIVKGETISSIAQKYNVSIEAIYKLNPKAKKTLQLNQVLSVPNSKFSTTTTSESLVSEQTNVVSHEVLPKETLYAITKQYKTTAQLLYKANPKLEAEGLKTGQAIVIPSGLSKNEIISLSNTNQQETVETKAALTHQVKAKESLYSIAKQYEITLKELQVANPNIGNKGLSIGQIITIPSNSKLIVNEVVVNSENVSAEGVPVIESEPKAFVAQNPLKELKTISEVKTKEITHEVLSKETKYGIAKKYGISIADLEKQNPNSKQRLIVGSKLTLQVSNEFIVNSTQQEVEVALVPQVKINKDSTYTSANISNPDFIDQLIQTASDKIGTRYRTGGITTDGFDCSGLMCATFGTFDIKLPRTSMEQSLFGERVEGLNAQKGDLIFFKTSGRSRINHVGMVVEVVDDEIKFIHSSTHSGVIISSTKEPYYQRNFAQVNRVLK